VSERSTWFRRYLLPGFAFKAVVIGGGYATGRELAEFFLPSGPWGGVFAMTLAMVIWSAVCIVTFLFARATDSRDYRTFFRNLLGPGWIVFEAAYFLFAIVILAVFGAAAGAIGQALFGWPPLVGTLQVGVVLSLWRLCTLHRARAGRVRRSRGRQLRVRRNRWGLGERRTHLCGLQHRRRGGDPAGAASPHQQP
jgi:uncharacterized membrane protein YkvI